MQWDRDNVTFRQPKRVVHSSDDAFNNLSCKDTETRFTLLSNTFTIVFRARRDFRRSEPTDESPCTSCAFFAMCALFALDFDDYWTKELTRTPHSYLQSPEHLLFPSLQ